MRSNVVEHFADGPVLTHGHVVRRHEPPDRSLRIAKQRQRDGTLGRCEQREQLARRRRRQFLEEQRAVVRRHVVQQRGDVVFCHRLEERFLRFLRQVFEDRRGILPRQHAKHDDLILGVQRGQQFRHVVGGPVPHHVPQASVVAGAKHRRELVCGPGRFADGRERLVTFRAGKLFFHLCQCRSHDIVMVHVRSHGLGGVEPHAMNQTEVAWCQGRRMRTEQVALGAAAAVMNDEPHVERHRLLGAFPGIAEQSCLVCCGERRRLADVDVG